MTERKQMKLKPYPKYKPSGVQWLGEIPEHWEVERLKRLTSRVTDGAHISPDISSPDFPFVSTVDISHGTIDFDHCLRTSKECYEYLLHTGCRPYKDDLLFSKDGTVGRTAVVAVDKEFVVASSLVIVSPKQEKLKSKFLDYWLNNACLQQDILLQLSGAALQRISVEKVSRFTVLLPPADEQRAIAEFLDRETAKIDRLVEKQKTLIERLKEKRTALISHVVTKGLDPKVKMKPSGIPWLGDIPEHWEVKPLKCTICFTEGPGIMAADFTEDGVPLLRISCIGARLVTLSDCNFVSEQLATTKWKHFRVKQGDLLISGSASTGFCSEVDSNTVGSIPYTGIIIIRPRRITSKNFVRWFFLSNSFIDQTILAKTGSTIQHFGPTHLSRMSIVLPPLAEQQAIAAHLDRETGRIDALVSKVEQAIERLQEYRTALISEAVTGKIDVRAK